MLLTQVAPQIEYSSGYQGLLWLVVTLIQLVDQTFQASQLNQTKRLVGVWLTDFYTRTVDR